VKSNIFAFVMNRQLLFCFFLLLTNVCEAQLIGRYWWRDEWNSETITFKPFHRFTFEHHGKSGIKKGFGKYKLGGDSLVLNFRTAKTHIKEIPVSEEIQVKNPFAYTLNISVAEPGEVAPIPVATVAVYKRGVIITAGLTDDNGKCQLQISADESVVEVCVKMEGAGEKKAQCSGQR
jgi:hypothetical protein